MVDLLLKHDGKRLIFLKIMWYYQSTSLLDCCHQREKEASEIIPCHCHEYGFKRQEGKVSQEGR
jgi:hypothetical protein